MFYLHKYTYYLESELTELENYKAMCLKKYSSDFEPFTLAFSTVSFEICLHIDYGYCEQGPPGVKS